MFRNTKHPDVSAASTVKFYLTIRRVDVFSFCTSSKCACTSSITRHTVRQLSLHAKFCTRSTLHACDICHEPDIHAIDNLCIGLFTLSVLTAGRPPLRIVNRANHLLSAIYANGGPFRTAHSHTNRARHSDFGRQSL